MQKYEVIICGAGISGLSAGIGLIQKGLNPEKFLILESGNRCGGNVESRRIDGNLVEIGPNSLMLKSQRVLDFIKYLKMYSEISTPKVGSKKRFLRRGDDIWQITPSTILSKLNSRSKLRLGAFTFSSASIVCNLLKNFAASSCLSFPLIPNSTTEHLLWRGSIILFL